MSDLKKTFLACVNHVQNSDSELKPSNELKLEMYALYKQATEGDVTGEKPGMMDFVKVAKFMAWEGYKGMASNEAMEKYISKVQELSPNFRSS